MLSEHSLDLLFWGVTGLVITLSIATWRYRLLPTAMAWVGMALIVATLALAPTGHGGVGLAMLPWLAVACAQLLMRSDSRS